MRSRILVVDDEESLLEFLRLLFEEEGYDVDSASSVSEARTRIGLGAHDLVLCDILMPDGNGLDLLREIKEAEPHTAVIMMTAYTSTKSAIEAMKLGAFQYVSKPFDVDELKVVVAKALEKTGLEAENVYLRRELEEKYQFKNIIGRSSQMQEVFSLIERVARTQSTVLIRGESGTGKELIARAIHYSGSRAPRTVSCRSTAARCPRTSSRASFSVTKRGLSPALCGRRTGFFRKPTAARCSSTRSAR